MTNGTALQLSFRKSGPIKSTIRGGHEKDGEKPEGYYMRSIAELEADYRALQDGEPQAVIRELRRQIATYQEIEKELLAGLAERESEIAELKQLKFG